MSLPPVLATLKAGRVAAFPQDKITDIVTGARGADIKATLQITDDESIEIIMDGQAEMVGQIEAISNTVVPDIALLDLAEPGGINGRHPSDPKGRKEVAPHI